MNDSSTRNGLLFVGIAIFLAFGVTAWRFMHNAILGPVQEEVVAEAQEDDQAADAEPNTLLVVGAVGGGLLAAAVGGTLLLQTRRRQEEEAADEVEERPAVGALGDDLRTLRHTADPDLSIPALYDMIRHVHRHAARAATGQGSWLEVDAFVHGNARRQIDMLLADVEAVDHQSVRRASAAVLADGHSLDVLIDAVRLQRGIDGQEQWVTVHDRWRMERAPAGTSLPAIALKTLSCPSCGKRWDADALGHCGWCGQVASPMARPWYLAEVLEHEAHPLVPDARSRAAEGTAATVPILRDPRLEEILADLRAETPDLDAGSLTAFVRRLVPVVEAGGDQWKRARAHCTESAWEAIHAEHDALNALGLRREREITPLAAELARVNRDRIGLHATVRVWWRLKDAVADASGQVVAGSRDETLNVSAYWTLLRTGPSASVGDVDLCPACGADCGQVDNAGSCGICHAPLPDGAHGWVLVRRDSVWSWHRPLADAAA
jgi:predicted lipid-binding transport protein (Tim44 family)